MGEPRKSYLGERSFPLILQNFHRYFLRLSYLIWGVLVYDAVKSFWFPNGFGIGLGSLILSVNVVLLACYIFGCHAFRHLIGEPSRQIIQNDDPLPQQQALARYVTADQSRSSGD